MKTKIKEKVLKRLKESHWATWRHFKDKSKNEEYYNLLFDAYLLGKQDSLAEAGKVIDEVRSELGYVLCYGLDVNLTKRQEKAFEKMFIELYEKKLKQKLGIK